MRCRAIMAIREVLAKKCRTGWKANDCCKASLKQMPGTQAVSKALEKSIGSQVAPCALRCLMLPLCEFFQCLEKDDRQWARPTWHR